MERRTWPGPVVAAVLGEFRPPPSLLRRTSRAPPRATRSPRPRAPHVTARGRTTGQWRASSLAEPDQTRARSLVSWQRLNAGAGSSTAIRGRSTASPLGSAPSKSLPVLNPSGDYYYWWLNTMVFPVMYNLIILVCRACFPDLQHGYLVAWLVLDYTSDLLYLLDIVVRFHTVGDTPPPAREEEYLFMVGDFLLAVMGFATIMGSMSSVIYNMNTADAAFYPDHGLVKKYMKLQHVNRKLERRVIDWYQHLQINKKITNEIAILQHLPERLRAEVAVSVHLSTLSQVQIFQNCEASLLEELVLKLQPQTYSPGEYVCRKGDIGREMYIIREGQLAVVADDGITQYAVLGAGLYFGEISIINIKGNMSGNRRTANIKSIGYSDLFCLSKEDLQEVLSEYPQAQTVMEEKGREILLKMNKLDMNAEAAEIALQEATESRLRGLDQQLDDLQTKFARLLAELESSALKIAYRVERLEWQTREWPMPEDLAGADDEGEPGEGTSKDEEGRATQEGPPGPE
ncbi:PREDICTED: cyclic nucleotide-gated cation channel alpha-4 isoform X3 [Rhinopithecus bieti]|uniref:cyclic nucleotide-gated cation channel alpha-4 isoform X3 n=1 Tax=Rhinopithecus bieti TaxID=61621 RepID=UPI00083BC1CF|nr:PREDICTED: cyclic nucleotide-gated cation channel alpha-4 isoform X3 [Rhinopithecus bieti]